MGLSGLPGLGGYLISHVREIFKYNPLKCFLNPLFLSFLWTCKLNIVCLMLSEFYAVHCNRHTSAQSVTGQEELLYIQGQEGQP